MLSMGLFLNHSSFSFDRYTKAPFGIVVRRLSKSSKVLRLARPLKAPISIVLMWFLLSCRISRCLRCLKLLTLMIWIWFSWRLSSRVLVEMPSGTSLRFFRTQITLLNWLLQEQTEGQVWALTRPATTRSWRANSTTSRGSNRALLNLGPIIICCGCKVILFNIHNLFGVGPSGVWIVWKKGRNEKDNIKLISNNCVLSTKVFQVLSVNSTNFLKFDSESSESILLFCTDMYVSCNWQWDKK